MTVVQLPQEVRAGAWLGVVTVMVIEVLPSVLPTTVPSPPSLRMFPWRGWQSLLSPVANRQPEDSVSVSCASLTLRGTLSPSS